MNFPELKKIVNTKKCLCLSDFQDLTKMYYECEFEDSELDEWIDFGAFLFGEIAYINIFSKVFTVSSVAYRKHIKKQKTYLMKDGNTGLTKIGKSANPHIRERTLQSEKPTISLIAKSEKNIEEFLHKRYSDKRVRGEWFALTKDDINEILKYF